MVHQTSIYYCDETLANTSKQSTQQKGEKEKEQRERGLKVSARRTKTQSGSQRGKGTNHIPDPHHIIPCA
jgi:hypothetical protein